MGTAGGRTGGRVGGGPRAGVPSWALFLGRRGPGRRSRVVGAPSLSRPCRGPVGALSGPLSRPCRTPYGPCRTPYGPCRTPATPDPDLSPPVRGPARGQGSSGTAGTGLGASDTSAPSPTSPPGPRPDSQARNGRPPRERAVSGPVAALVLVALTPRAVPGARVRALRVGKGQGLFRRTVATSCRPVGPRGTNGVIYVCLPSCKSQGFILMYKISAFTDL